jgi:hypothetical protein
MSDQIAGGFHKIALRYVNDRNAGRDSYELASATIADAQTLEGLNSTAVSRLANYQREIAIGRVSNLAQQGLQGNYMFWPSYSNLLQTLQRDAYRACTGRGAAMEACASTMTSLSQATQLPQQASGVDQQRAAFQAQIQQQMSSVMGGGNQNGMVAGAVNANGMPNPMAGGIPNMVPGAAPQIGNPAFPNATPMPQFGTISGSGVFGASPMGTPMPSNGMPFRTI